MAAAEAAVEAEQKAAAAVATQQPSSPPPRQQAAGGEESSEQTGAGGLGGCNPGSLAAARGTPTTQGSSDLRVFAAAVRHSRYRELMRVGQQLFSRPSAPCAPGAHASVPLAPTVAEAVDCVAACMAGRGICSGGGEVAGAAQQEPSCEQQQGAAADGGMPGASLQELLQPGAA